MLQKISKIYLYNPSTSLFQFHSQNKSQHHNGNDNDKRTRECVLMVPTTARISPYCQEQKGVKHVQCKTRAMCTVTVKL